MLHRDLQSASAICLKGVLFVVLGSIAGALLLLENWSWRTVTLLAICIWAWCRAYFFAFYVIERWVDPSYKFSGLGSFVVWLFSKRPPRP
jgi:hypothetical protein